MAKMWGKESALTNYQLLFPYEYHRQTDQGQQYEYSLTVQTFWRIVMNLPVAITTAGLLTLLTQWEV